MKKPYRCLVVLACLPTFACTANVYIEVIRYPWAERLKARPAGCDAVVYLEREMVPAGCRDVGDVFVGDDGFSINCAAPRMLGELRKQTCAYGADAARVIRSEEPHSSGSSCYQVRAAFLTCDRGREAAESSR